MKIKTLLALALSFTLVNLEGQASEDRARSWTQSDQIYFDTVNEYGPNPNKLFPALREQGADLNYLKFNIFKDLVINRIQFNQTSERLERNLEAFNAEYGNPDLNEIVNSNGFNAVELALRDIYSEGGRWPCPSTKAKAVFETFGDLGIKLRKDVLEDKHKNKFYARQLLDNILAGKEGSSALEGARIR